MVFSSSVDSSCNTVLDQNIINWLTETNNVLINLMETNIMHYNNFFCKIHYQNVSTITLSYFSTHNNLQRALLNRAINHDHPQYPNHHSRPAIISPLRLTTIRNQPLFQRHHLKPPRTNH